MSAKPILFSGPMVRALLEGRKTQTRRLLKPQPDPPPHWDGRIGFSFMCPERHYEMRGWTKEDGPLMRHRPLHYWNGDLLWVRETWVNTWDAFDSDDPPASRNRTIYRASCAAEAASEITWRPSIFMPRDRSRLTLEVTNVKVERLQDISEADARAEGVFQLPNGMWRWEAPVEAKQTGFHTPRAAFDALWCQVNGPASWPANPWVVAVSFRVHACNVDEIPSANKLGKAA